MEEVNRIICVNQQDLFELLSKRRVDMYTFIPQYMTSAFCNREIDSDYSFFQFADVEDWIDFLKKEFKILPDPFTKDRIDTITSGWIGFTYRYLQIKTKISSRELIDKIPLENLLNSYAGLHTVDEDMAYDIIVKDFCL